MWRLSFNSKCCRVEEEVFGVIWFWFWFSVNEEGSTVSEPFDEFGVEERSGRGFLEDVKASSTHFSNHSLAAEIAFFSIKPLTKVDLTNLTWIRILRLQEDSDKEVIRQRDSSKNTSEYGMSCENEDVENRISFSEAKR